MASIIEMPKLSDTMEEGGVANWLVKVGDAIEDGEPLVEIETDKATMEYISPLEGTILEILVKAGETCALNAPIAIIGEKGESYDKEQLIAAHSGSASASPADAGKASTSESKQQKASPAPLSKDPIAAGEKAAEGTRIKASPLAKKLAKAKGIDLSQVVGSGPAGRIVQRDIEAGVSTDVPTQAATSATAHGGASAHADSKLDGDVEVIPLNMMRKTIAKRLLQGKNEAPHFYLTVSAHMTNLLNWRKELNEHRAADERISVNDLLILATSRALMKHKEVNSSWQGDHILRYSKAHVAVAVAIDGGLITPVIRNASHLGAQAISSEAKNLIEKAKAGALAPDDYAGGTFTISNLGMMGIESFTAIINPPQAAILAVGATIQTPVVDKDGNVVVEPRMKMTMSCDHRVIDGATGAQFLQTLVRFIEHPLMMLG